MTPLVSITLSAYNVEHYIADSLDCLIKQTYSPIEIICIDDGSTDQTLSILEEYAKKDKRIKVISKKNEGLAVARNLSLKLASGKYIIFLDGDDLFDLKMIEKAVQKAENEDADMIIWDYVVFYDKSEIKEKKKQTSALEKLNKQEDNDNTLFHGTIKNVNSSNGKSVTFGFITGDDSEEYFFHRGELNPTEVFDNNNEARGVRVAFVPFKNKKGLNANNVHLL